MLGRFVREKYEIVPYEIVAKQVKAVFDNSDYVIGNLESPVTDEEESDSLKFAASAKMLNQISWIDFLSLSNNHINDFGEQGMTDTITYLDSYKIGHNGLFKDSYAPIKIERGKSKIAIVTCTDMLNYEFANDCSYKILRVDQPELKRIIKVCKSDGFLVLVFAHVGSLFCRYPNPPIREILYGMIDNGADAIITAHSHCLGGMDVYKGVPIFYSLGDFLMDGSSFRRRQACALHLEIENNQVKEWSIIPVKTSMGLQVVMPSEKESRKMKLGFEHISANIKKHKDNYTKFYGLAYKKEMLLHSMSTLCFLYKSKGPKGFVHVVLTRIREIKKMADRMIFGRSKMRYDSDAVGKNILSKDKIR